MGPISDPCLDEDRGSVACIFIYDDVSMRDITVKPYLLKFIMGFIVVP